MDTANYMVMPGIPEKKTRSRKCKPEYKPIASKETVLNIVCHHFDKSFKTLNTHSRERIYVYPRQVIMYLLKEFSLPSFKSVGEVFGKDHTTVMHAIVAINNLRDTDEKVLNEVKYLESMILATR